MSPAPTNHTAPPLSNLLTCKGPPLEWNTISRAEEQFFSSRSRGLPVSSQYEDLKALNLIPELRAFVYRLRPRDTVNGSLDTDTVQRNFFMRDESHRCDTGMERCPTFHIFPNGPLTAAFSADGEIMTISHVSNRGFTTVKRVDGFDAMVKRIIVQRCDIPEFDDMEPYPVHTIANADRMATGKIYYVCEDPEDEDKGPPQEAADTHPGIDGEMVESTNQHTANISKGLRERCKSLRAWTSRTFS